MRERDKDDIRHQIDIILRAHINQDWGQFRQTHSPEWVGFFPNSPEIIRGRNDLKTTAENSPLEQRFIAYEMIEIDYQFYGGICVVPFVARARGMTSDGEPFEFRIQSVGVYVKQQEWRQSVSDIQFLQIEEND